MSEVKPLKVFCSYSHKDEDGLDELRNSLASLRRQGLIEDWHDRQIPPGKEWDSVIKDNLKSASLILLLVSSDFIASDYCMELETRRALERHKEGTATVIPIFYRQCRIEGLSFHKLQGTPSDVSWITEQKHPDKAWTEVVNFIHQAADLRLNPEPIKPFGFIPSGIPTQKPLWQRFAFHPVNLLGLVFILLFAVYWFWQSRSILAEGLLKQGEYLQAQKACEAAAASSARDRCLRITRLMLEKRQVEKFYADATQEDSAYALAIMGEAETYQKDFKNAEKHYREAIKRNPDIAQAYFGMGQVYQAQMQPDKALSWYQKAVDKAPKNRRFTLNLASAYAESGQLEKAETYYRAVLKLDRSVLLAYAEIIDVLLKQEKQKEAAELALVAKQGLQKNPDWKEKPLNKQEWQVLLDVRTEYEYATTWEDKQRFLDWQFGNLAKCSVII